MSYPPKSSLRSGNKKAVQLRINLRNIPEDLHAAFKADCARRGRTMTGMVIAFMRDVINCKQPVVDASGLSRCYPDPR